jgi:multicomponent Na+:H+ antiporter subunit E
MRKAGTFVTAFVFSLVLYLILMNALDVEVVIIGVLVSLLSSAVLTRFLDLPVKYLNPIRILRLVVYLPYFFLEMIRANLRIALIVLNPRLPIKPEIKSGKTTLETTHGKLLLSSSITLTPGTLTVDVQEDEFQIHCVSNPKSAEEIMRPFETYIKRITE